MAIEFKAAWKKIFSNPVLAFSVLAVLLAIPRFIWLLSGAYNNVIVIFLIMWALPFLLLTPAGRVAIGIKRPSGFGKLFLTFAIGATCAYLVHALGVFLFDRSVDHWYVTVMNSFNKNNLIADIKPNPLLFLLVSLPTMIFSPIGEEFFFRGMIHEAFREKYNDRVAVWADASFFGVTHLAHHGIVAGASLIVLPSAVPWVLLMMAVSMVLSLARKKTDSIWGAVSCHAGFNLGMMVTIFYLLHE